jgi:MarR family transcriptional regulator, lower aerobic nicotinate degradation pathway regulator
MLSHLPGHLLRRAHQISDAIFAIELQKFDLTPLQIGTVIAIQQNPLIEAARLSDILAIDGATLSGVLHRLELKKLIYRRSSESDKRLKLISLTVKGEKLFHRAEASVDKVQASILTPLDADERRVFMQLLFKLVNEHQVSLNSTSPAALRRPRAPIQG